MIAATRRPEIQTKEDMFSVLLNTKCLGCSLNSLTQAVRQTPELAQYWKPFVADFVALIRNNMHNPENAMETFFLKTLTHILNGAENSPKIRRDINQSQCNKAMRMFLTCLLEDQDPCKANPMFANERYDTRMYTCNDINDLEKVFIESADGTASACKFSEVYTLLFNHLNIEPMHTAGEYVQRIVKTHAPVQAFLAINHTIRNPKVNTISIECEWLRSCNELTEFFIHSGIQRNHPFIQAYLLCVAPYHSNEEKEDIEDQIERLTQSAYLPNDCLAFLEALRNPVVTINSNALFNPNASACKDMANLFTNSLPAIGEKQLEHILKMLIERI